jgi:hypothetical protein
MALPSTVYRANIQPADIDHGGCPFMGQAFSAGKNLQGN